MKKFMLFSGFLAGMIGMSGCAAANVFAVANNITGTIVNTGILAGAFGVAANIDQITQFLQNLIGGL
ncbi:MAG: hypothetical protein GX629_02660 [Phycisphaerae bacterium]|nr:hypothetical protein [Phycisphaerae bacterium]